VKENAEKHHPCPGSNRHNRDDILLGIEFDAKPLFEEAQRIEEHIKEIQKQAVVRKDDKGAPRPSMYG
jgi:predicted ATP-grasp superfamily ATP-dependent carboligase